MHRSVALAFILGACLLSACAQQTASVTAPTTIAYFEDDEAEGKKFRHCTVKTGWEVTELAGECGPPFRTFKGSGSEERCAAYETLQRRSAMDKEYVVVCMQTSREVKKGRKSKGGEATPDTEVVTTRVTDVYRVVSIPELPGGSESKRPR